MSHSPVVDINTTPLIDVLLVLLIVFMIAAPASTARVDAKLPLASTTPAAPSPALNVYIQASASTKPQITINESHGSRSEHLARIRQAQRVDAELLLRVKTAPDADYAHLVQALALLQRAGVKRILVSP